MTRPQCHSVVPHRLLFLGCRPESVRAAERRQHPGERCSLVPEGRRIIAGGQASLRARPPGALALHVGAPEAAPEPPASAPCSLAPSGRIAFPAQHRGLRS